MRHVLPFDDSNWMKKSNSPVDTKMAAMRAVGQNVYYHKYQTQIGKNSKNDQSAIIKQIFWFHTHIFRGCHFAYLLKFNTPSYTLFQQECFGSTSILVSISIKSALKCACHFIAMLKLPVINTQDSDLVTNDSGAGVCPW